MKRVILPLLLLILILLFSSLVSAVIFNIEEARKAEWDRFETYKNDYIKFHDLEAFTGQINEYNLIRKFGFRGPDYYYIPPRVLRAKYNPPLQGEPYYTPTRGYDSSLYSPSAIKYYGEKINNKYTGFIPSTLNNKYFDHPDIYRAYDYHTPRYPYYGAHRFYGGYSYQGYDYYLKNIYSEEPAYYARIAEPLNGGFYIMGFY